MTEEYKVKMTAADVHPNYLRKKILHGKHINLASNNNTVTISVPFGPLHPIKAVPELTWMNQGTSNVVFRDGRAVIESKMCSSGYSILYKAAPTPPYKVTVMFKATPIPINVFHSSMLCFLNTVTGQFQDIQTALFNGSTHLWVENWNDIGIINSNLRFFGYPYTTEQPLFFQLEDDGTDRHFRYSFDGENFLTMHSVPRDNFLTPNAVGFGFRQDGFANASKCITVYSWIES